MVRIIDHKVCVDEGRRLYLKLLVTTNILIGQSRKYKMCNKLDKSKNFVPTQLQMQCNLTSVILFFGKVPKTH